MSTFFHLLIRKSWYKYSWMWCLNIDNSWKWCHNTDKLCRVVQTVSVHIQCKYNLYPISCSGKNTEICFVTIVVFKSIALGKFQRKSFELRLWEGISIKIAVKKVESVGIWDGLYHVYFNMGLPQTIPWTVLSILPISCSSMSRIMVMADRVRASL